MIDIQLQKPIVAAGTDLSGRLVWQPERAKPPKQVKISIGWYTEGRGTRDRQTVNEISLDPDQFVASRGDQIPFSISVPYDGPVTYNGNLLRVIWEIKVIVDFSGIFAKDDKQSLPFQVIPRHLK